MNREGKKRRKVKEGIVVSNKMQKTVAVAVESTLPHPKYQKVIRRKKKYFAHCEKGEIREGQRVQIQEVRPLSKRKRWIVKEVLP